jgi:hypothetical protein
MVDGKDIVPTGAGPPLLPEHKAFRVDLSGFPIPMRRTFSALDRLVALPFEALGDRLEQSLKSNLDGHVDAVQKNRTKRGKKARVDDPPLKMAKMILEWAESASDVGPEEKELSAFWRAVLDEILDEDDEAAELIQVVRSLRKSDVRFFLRRFVQPTWRNRVLPFLDSFTSRDAIARLQTAGLVDRATSLLFMIAAALGVGLAMNLVSRRFPGAFDFLNVGSPYAEIFFLGGLPIVLLLSIVSLCVRSPTEFGTKLCNRYREYLDQA